MEPLDTYLREKMGEDTHSSLILGGVSSGS